ncbi:hypothetical protein BJ912DRAFT_856060 [Pholiota molesta]|nr:hypothetical protein BJ912DRAFT_856060 [Pholiota molesta]
MTRRSSRSSTSEKWPVSADDQFTSPEVSRQATPDPDDEGAVVVVHRGKTYGGFSAITWPDHVRRAKNLPPKCALAKDIPHVFEDHVNNMTPYTRMLPEMRKVYEARILENTVEDEPDAPPIEIQNDVDEEATPPWEFFYSNKMWHGEGVPLPDTKSLLRCNCKGVCNPKSKTCACLKRQREACQDPNLEFAYDKTGKLKIPGYPIFECNDFCGCGDECRNRVVQHGRKVSVAIRKTPAKGWGVFATKKILAGTYIGIYAGELITDVIAQQRGVKYNKFGRTYLFDIDFHHLRDSDDQDWTNQFTVDAYHAGNFTRFLNHSCDPNSRLFACYINEGNIQKPLLAIFSLRDIEPNEEICFNYNGNYPDDDEDENDKPASQDPNEQTPMEPDSRDIIYEKCMCGAYNCTGMSTLPFFLLVIV